MKRIVTYLYVYENHIKSRNIGFARIFLNDNHNAIEIHIKGLGRFSGSLRVHLLIDAFNQMEQRQNERVLAHDIGEINLNNGYGDVRLEFEELRIIGIRINVNNIYFVASCLREDRASEVAGDYQVVNDNEKIIKKSDIEIPAESSSKETQISYKKIQLADIKRLPQSNWYLSNNSFLLHGYFLYNYLLIKSVRDTDTESFYIGVPGRYIEAEKETAALFGFEQFEIENKENPQEDPEGKFGYWFCQIDMAF